MWLTNSSIGRKVIMSVTGIALILFLTFHACMNLVALIDAEAYDMVCGALGANWYAVAGTVGLAALVAIHFIYAIILTLQNRKARGNNRYTFSNPVFTVLYIVWFVAIWFHMTHGFWSAFQTLGLNNKTWFCRWKTIGSVYVSLVMLIFLAVAVIFFIQGFFCAA